jgi:hypothetical protein
MELTARSLPVGIDNIPEMLDRTLSEKRQVLYNILWDKFNPEYHAEVKKVSEVLCALDYSEDKISSLAYDKVWAKYSEVGLEGFAISALENIATLISETLEVKDDKVVAKGKREEIVATLLAIFETSAKFVTK